jgi:hypothetical protein
VSARLIFRNALEFAVLFALWYGGIEAIDQQAASTSMLLSAVMAIAFAKTAFFGVENIRQLKRASDENWAYHRFILLLLVNMLQIVASFGLDYHLLHRLRPESFAVVAPTLAGAELVFEFFYFSAELHVLRLRRHHAADRSGQATYAHRDRPGVRDRDLPAERLHRPERVAAEAPRVVAKPPAALAAPCRLSVPSAGKRAVSPLPFFDPAGPSHYLKDSRLGRFQNGLRPSPSSSTFCSTPARNERRAI